MGITGLLPFLDKASERINITTLANKSVAIDSYCWLHKGAFGVGDKLARGEQTDVHIMYCIKFVNMLLSHNIKPILVFDGRHLPAKAETEAKRRESRQNAKQRAIELMRKGNHSEARNYLRRCVDITHEMALQLIQVCRTMNVDCVVAPYEADAQLAYLNKIGLADYVITEDSDLTLFGCRKILFKLDLTGNCVLVDAEKLHLAMDCRPEKFTMDKFRLMCILSGCDYIDSLPGIGLVKACKFVMKTEETDLMRALDKIPAYLNMRHLVVTEEYKVNVFRAIATFLHMVVFDPRRRKQVRLHEIDEIGTNAEYCCNAGELLDDATALNLAVGNLNPFSMKKLDNWHPDQAKAKIPTTISKKGLKVAKHPSIWTRDYRWATSLNGTASSTGIDTALQKTTVRKSPRQQKRLIEKMIEGDEDKNLPTESQNDDLILNQYMALSEPSQKRFKEEIEDSDDEEITPGDQIETEPTKKQTTPNRNPFKKSVSGKDELLSPTRISKENNSLIKNQSPVKHIEYSKLEKLSRFNRTVMPNKQRVISRFFGTVSTTPKESDGQTLAKADSGIQSDSNSMDAPVGKTGSVKRNSGAQMKSPNLLDSNTMTPTPTLYFNRNNDIEFSPNNEGKLLQNDANEADEVNKAAETDADIDFTSESQRSILNKFKFALKEKMEDADDAAMEIDSSQGTSDKADSEPNELPIVLSDTENEIDGSQSAVTKESTNRMWLSANQKPKTSAKTKKAAMQRKKTASNSTSAIKSNSVPIQSRLAMFGFQAKPQAQP